MNKTLEERFIAFTKGLDGAELIDELALTPEQQASQKADLFFNDRKIVGELKSLKTNTESKVETILEPYKNTPEWPHFYGTQEVHKVLEHLPDKEKLQARVFSAVTDSIEGIIEKANRQIRATKKTFSLPTAGGLLIILNDLVDVISPNVLADRARKCLQKRTATGEIRYPEVTLIWAINGAHYAQITPTLKAMPILIMPSGQPDLHNIQGFVISLGRKWSQYEGIPYLKTDAATFKKAEFRKFSDDAKKNEPITRQESWSLQYKENPYLRSLSKEELLEHGQKIISQSGRAFSNKAKRRPNKETMSKVGAQFTHFMDEINYRGIDMREFAPKVQELNERFHIVTKGKNRQLKTHKNKIGRAAPCPCQSGKSYQRCCGKKAIT